MFDAHCHLEYMENPEQIIMEAKKRNCSLCTAVSDLKDVRKVLALSEKNKNVFVALGLHPERALKYGSLQIEDYEKIIRKNAYRIVGIGEIGLDYAWVKEPKDQERTKEIFRRFLRIAKDLNKTVVIHCRQAFPDTLEILKQELTQESEHEKNRSAQNNIKNKTNVIIHFFSGKKPELEECLKRNYWISYNTIAVRSKSYRKLIKKTPINRILLETDAPWCDPNPHQNNSSKIQNKQNQKQSQFSGYALTNVPWNIAYTAELVARLKDMTKQEVLEKTEHNARKAFNITPQK